MAGCWRTLPWPTRRGGCDGRCLLDRLRSDPFLDSLGPRLFEVDQAGELLLWDARPSHRLPAEQTWPGALAQLAAEGRLARAALLDRCLGRLLRGGRPATLGGFVACHEALVRREAPRTEGGARPPRWAVAAAW